MVVSRPTTPELKRELDIPTDVASAMRKSLSHDMFVLSSNNEEASPIGTPGAETPLSGDTSGLVNNMRVGGSFVSTGLGPTTADAFPDYQLWNHHITDVKNTASTAASYNNVLEILQEWDFSNSSSTTSKPFQRRSSIEDVLKVRQWLNPRSSFAAPSSSEPEIQPPLSRKSTSTNVSETGSNIERVGWITLLLSSEDIKPIIALNNSISACQSKYRLLVLYCAGTDELTEELKLRGIDCVAIHPLKPIHRGEICAEEEQGMKWPILSLWREMYDKFDNVCYLSPYTIMSTNMDELLQNNDEIDNETCVLLANRTYPPSLLLLKPHDEIHMVLEEFLTFYGVDTEKVTRVRSMDDWSILAELFSTSFTLVDDLYGADVTSLAREGYKQLKLLDYSKLKPWLAPKETNDVHSKLWWFNFNNV